jgi:hypothetical protein
MKDKLVILLDSSEMFWVDYRNTKKKDFFNEKKVHYLTQSKLRAKKIQIYNDDRIVNFKILDDQTRIMIYAQTKDMQRQIGDTFTMFYDNAWILYLTKMVRGKNMINVNGNANFDTLGVDFRANHAVGLYYSDEQDHNDFQFRFFKFHEKKDQDNEFFIDGRFKESNQIHREEFEDKDNLEDLETNVSTLCMLYKLGNNQCNLLVMTDTKSNVFLYELNGNKTAELSQLEHKDTVEIAEDDNLEEGRAFPKDYVVRTLKCPKNNYVIMLTKYSEIYIYKIDYSEKKFEEPTIISPLYAINDIYLSGNGRFLLMGGVLFDSVVSLDLDGLDSDNFNSSSSGGLISLNQKFAPYPDAGENQKDLTKKLIFMNFLDYDNYTGFLEESNGYNKSEQINYERRRNEENRKFNEKK